MTSSYLPLLTHTSSFLSLFHAQTFTPTVSTSLLTSPTHHVINPRNHRTKGDRVSIRLPLSRVSGLSDEEILALLTKGFFGGWVFAIEGWVMRICGGVLPAAYIDLPPSPSKGTIWHAADIPSHTLVPAGTMLFDFILVASHVPSPATAATPTPRSSHVDYGFGSDQRAFAGAHRFGIERREWSYGSPGPPHNKVMVDKKEEDGDVELYVECFRCNPLVDRDSWAEWMPWLHYWYARLLWAEAVRRVLVDGGKEVGEEVAVVD